MTMDEIKSILDTILDKVQCLYDVPNEEDWAHLSKKFNCMFDEDFKNFIQLMSEYEFPGDLFNVSSGKTNGNDNISFVYDYEIRSGKWNPEFIPFYGIGNGDYFCISAEKNPNSPVYYFFHEDCRFECYSNSFEEWIKGLPDFL